MSEKENIKVCDYCTLIKPCTWTDGHGKYFCSCECLEKFEKVAKFKTEKPEFKDIQAFQSQFEFKSPITVSESFKEGKTIISGTLLAEGLSKNGNFYTVESLEQLDGLKDIPIYVGTTAQGKHTKASGIIGKILKTTFDKIARKVKFVAEITNRTIAEAVSSNWGISVGGKANGSYILDSFGKILMKIKDLVLDHVQLLLPNTLKGVESATVEKVVHETMVFGRGKRLDRRTIAKIVATLVAEGEI